MSYTASEQEAIDRLKTKYNSNAYNPTTNPGGFANDGHQENFPAALEDAGTVAQAVGAKADEAEASATAAASSETAAGQSESNAAASETAAGNSATAAEASETNAAASETAAGNSATAAGTSETNAAASATAAGNSATAAGNSETAAAASETAAGNSASAAGTSETNAAASETAAANSATAAGTSETNAAASETAAGNSATAAAASETGAAAHLAAAGLPTPIVNDRLLMTEGGAYVFKDLIEVMRALGGVPTFDLVYTSGTVGAAQNGNSYTIDVSTHPTFSVADATSIPVGWSVTVKAVGDPTGYQTASMALPVGNYEFCGEDHGFLFYLLGNGESFRLVKTGASTIQVIALGSAEDLSVLGTLAGSGQLFGPTAWTSVPADTFSENTFLTQGTNGGGPVAASGIYTIDVAVYFTVVVAAVSALAYLEIVAKFRNHSYWWGNLATGDSWRSNATHTMRLKQGDLVNAQLLTGDANIYYRPFVGDSSTRITFLRR